jgi:WD40 repeat protein
MRLYPRSTRGTWLLAMAGWLGLCGMAWLLMPVLPRAEWAIPEESQFEGFLPSGRVLVTSQRRVDWSGCGTSVIRDDPFRGWESSTGRMVEEYRSRDASPFPERPKPVCPPNTEFEAVSPDGGSLAASVQEGETVKEVGVWEVGSLRRIGVAPLPAGVKWPRVYLGSAGRILAASLTYSQQKGGVAMCWETATGRELLRVSDAWPQLALSTDGSTLVTIGDRTGASRYGMVAYRMSVWDVGTGRVRLALDLAGGGGFVVDWDSSLISPDGRTVAAPTGSGPVDPLGNLARRLGMPWPFGNLSSGACIALFDVATGKELGTVSGKFDDSIWSPDGKLLATLDESRHLVRVWDIPLCKPLGWFALGAGILALPFAGLAWRRSRQLRREAA